MASFENNRWRSYVKQINSLKINIFVKGLFKISAYGDFKTV